MCDDAEPNDQPDAEPIDQPEPEDRRARQTPTADQLLAIIDRHRAEFDQRDFDYDLLRPGRKLTRGTSEHSQAFRRAPQWHQHIGASAGGRKANYLTLIRDEARQAFGPNAAEAVESLL